ncbi:MAG: prolyl oligopeptidase family serine peptidase [Saprospiraceae bacterium]|nr:prolyl oligopeptidase family serine peptidase [Saprospiraceae bacterium]
MKSVFLTVMCVAFVLPLHTQTLSLEEIMKGDEFIGHQPFNHRWSWDGQTIYFEWNPENEISNSTYFWKRDMKNPERLGDEKMSLVSADINRQYEYDVVYFIKNQVLYSFDKKTKIYKKIFHSRHGVSDLTRSINPDIIFFEQSGNVFQMNVKDVSVLQLTNFRSGKKDDSKENDNYLITQQKELFQYVRDQKTEENWKNERTEKQKEFFPKEYFYGASAIGQITPSPDGRFITFTESNYPPSKTTNVEQYISEDGYTNHLFARSKVSQSNLFTSGFGIYSVVKDTFYMVCFSGLTGIKENPEYYKEYDKLKDKEKIEKPISVQHVIFNKKGNLSVMDIRSQDNKDRWIVQLDLNTGLIFELDHQHDEAWINGPGIGYGHGTLGFLNEQTIYFQSEVTGYAHLYLMNVKTKEKRAQTSGKWEVYDVKPAKDGKSFYLISNMSHPGNREFYSLDIASGKLTRILTKPGAHEVVISPDEKTLLIRYSFKNKPWELYIADNKPNPVYHQITFSTTPKFNEYPWKDVEVITFKANDSTTIYARLYQPYLTNKNKAAVIFVHGAGYLQNAHNYWSSYYREFMFHHLLTDAGYTVLDIDYRGSEGYGRDVRTGIYRHMGGLDLSDQLDGKKLLVDIFGIDTDRVGIYGGSYGGFITLMALLTAPGTFKAGAALRSVTDWAHYNHGYTSNILNFPETDSIAYVRSSPIYFAENLSDRLLMLHGMVDDNVQFQDVVRLSQRFIELGKKGWDLAVFPVEAHGFKETYSWVDEYRRILELFNEALLE